MIYMCCFLFLQTTLSLSKRPLSLLEATFLYLSFSLTLSSLVSPSLLNILTVMSCVFRAYGIVHLYLLWLFPRVSYERSLESKQAFSTIVPLMYVESLFVLSVQISPIIAFSCSAVLLYHFLSLAVFQAPKHK